MLLFQHIMCSKLVLTPIVAVFKDIIVYVPCQKVLIWMKSKANEVHLIIWRLKCEMNSLPLSMRHFMISIFLLCLRSITTVKNCIDLLRVLFIRGLVHLLFVVS